jgi:hypothetical protein
MVGGSNYYCSFLLLMLTTCYSAQVSKSNLIYLEDEAAFYMHENQNEKAFGVFEELCKSVPDNYLYQFEKGLCALHIPSKKAEAISIFEEIVKAKIVDAKKVDKQLGSQYKALPLYYLGRAYHTNYKFDQAIKTLTDFIATKPADLKFKKEAEQYIKSSEFGIEIVKNPINCTISNLGGPVNTEADEYVPVVSGDRSILIFTYRGKKSKGGLMNKESKPDTNGVYFEDIFFSKQNADSSWTVPGSVGDSLNTEHHDASIALSPGGDELYTFSGTEKDGGDIFVCHLEGDHWGAPKALNKNINTVYWEGSCSVSADGKYLYFASERPGGFGGKDLYVSEKQDDGSWGFAMNLGEKINTEADEDAPFIHLNGITLFFSSQGHNSIGGFDVMYTTKNGAEWTPVQNAGYPINTTDDDRYYILSPDGQVGYISSNRNNQDAKGGQDIYTVKPGLTGDAPSLVMIVGTVYGNGVPIEAEIKITKKTSGETVTTKNSNSTSGKYLVALAPKESYLFKISAAEYSSFEEELNTDNLRTFAEIKKDFRLVKNGYADSKTDTAATLNNLLAQIINKKGVKEPPAIKDSVIKPVQVKDTTIVAVTTTTTTTATTNPCDNFKTIDFSQLKRKSLNDISVYNKLLQIGDNLCADKMEFTVQVGAYRHPEKFKWDHLKEFSTPQKTDYPDQIARFTIGNFKSIHEAEKLRQRIIAKGQKDAWLTCNINGKRYTLEELIMVDFFNKNISLYRKNLELLKDVIVFK